MQTLYEIGGDGRWTGAVRELGDDDGAPLGWVDIAPPPLDAGQVAVWGDGWAVVACDLLGDERARRLAALADRRWRAEVGGTTYAGVALRTDRESQGLVDSMDRALADGIIASVQFKTSSGVILDVGPADATAIRTAVVLHVQACRTREAELAGLIEAAADVDALRAIDIEAGWP